MKQKLAAIISLIALTFIMTLASCAPITESENEDSSQITIKLPPIASYSIRALTTEQVSRLQRETAKYRVTFSGAGQTITREGDGTTFSATFPTGAQVGVTVYCLNTKGEVIVKTVTKTVTISSGANSLSFKLSEDGEEIEVDQEDPSNPDTPGTGGDTPTTPPTTDTPGGDTPPSPPAPQPVTGTVTYNGGTGASNVPNDTQNYDVGNEVTLQTGEPTRAGYEFAGWTADKELKYDDAGQERTIVQGVEFASGGSNVATNIKITSFKMPSGGVVLTAKWTPITYTIKFNNGGGSGSQADLQFTVEDNKALPTANEVTFTPPQGKVFDHWATQADGVSIELEFIILQIKGGNGSSYVTGNNEVEIFAVWEDRPDLTSTPVAGDIIMKDGTLKKASDTDINADDTIAVVYKVDSDARKVWAVGKVLSANGMVWASEKDSAQGYNTKITDLQEGSGYTDGSTGLDILRATVSDANGPDFATKYPAWDYACNYGQNQGLINFQTGWYLPSKQELQEVYNNKDAIETALAQTGASRTSFVSSSVTILCYYWSSSQFESGVTSAYELDFERNQGASMGKGSTYSVCAVRQFTY